MNGPFEIAVARLQAVLTPASANKPIPVLIAEAQSALRLARQAASLSEASSVKAKLPQIERALNDASAALAVGEHYADACAVALSHLLRAIGDLSGKHCMCADIAAFNDTVYGGMPSRGK